MNSMRCPLFVVPASAGGIPPKGGTTSLAGVLRAALGFLFFPLAGRAADDWAPNLTLNTVWNSNATNANAPSDRIGALQTTADLVASNRLGLGRDDSLHFTFHLGGEWWPRFNALLQGGVGGRAEWRHKFGLGALAPVFSAEYAVDAIAAKESGRQGTASGVTLALRKRLNAALRVTLSQEFGDYAARLAPYDRRWSDTAVELDHDFNDTTRFTLRASYRDGDVLSYATPPRPDLVALAPNRIQVTTFGTPMVAYSIDASTVAFRGGITHALDETSAAILSYEWRDTHRSSLRYVNHLVSLALVHQF